jgi:hypothetical protein
MKVYDVVLSAYYQVEAKNEDDAYYEALTALKKDLPNNAAPLESEVTEVK